MAKSPIAELYFWGRITRDEAQDYIGKSGRKDGMFLLRESLSVPGNYAISVAFGQSVHHYNIVKQPDGKFKIDKGQKFVGPVELTEHHRKNLDGFLTLLSIPVNRPEGRSPLAFRGLTVVELDYFLYQKAKEMGIKDSNLEKTMSSQREKLIKRVCQDLHKKLPWFHGQLRREDSDVVMQQYGHVDGRFLVRQKEDGSYALTLSFGLEAKHYKIDVHGSNRRLAIQDGPKFDTLIELVDHYHSKPDGLLCVLREPVIYKDYVMVAPSNMEVNPSYARKGAVSNGQHQRVSGAHLAEFDAEDVWDQPEDDTGFRVPDKLQSDSKDRQKIYDSWNSHQLDPSRLELQDTLGSGNFGSVRMGYYTEKGRRIPVAVKTLKDDSTASAAEFTKEAELMLTLKHPNIVRLIGMCTSTVLMLVLELAPLGPLNKFLKKSEGKKMSFSGLVHLMAEVCEGMVYLESKNFVHRDLAARNVLLVTTTLPKISDFGMSRALQFGGDIYTAHQSGKWPLKWYAPECLFYYKFDSKSDVWSFGITCWETFTRGERPYKGKKGQDLINFLNDGNRLSQPSECPDALYRIMLSCWHTKSSDRPSFVELREEIRRFRMK